MTRIKKNFFRIYVSCHSYVYSVDIKWYNQCHGLNSALAIYKHGVVFCIFISSLWGAYNVPERRARHEFLNVGTIAPLSAPPPTESTPMSERERFVFKKVTKAFRQHQVRSVILLQLLSRRSWWILRYITMTTPRAVVAVYASEMRGAWNFKSAATVHRFWPKIRVRIRQQSGAVLEENIGGQNLF